jgi:hypothetical protein
MGIGGAPCPTMGALILTAHKKSSFCVNSVYNFYFNAHYKLPFKSCGANA